ncbi:MAG: sulfite exporter TauE/SafE family protein [Treponema sp.]|jgi:sulfite exporter TauE/SafE/copper chaperone CopZ/plastocyanin domain-containing protein|nr:sulfite exporter TauE/SafE family protein [Treponema sp.]
METIDLQTQIIRIDGMTCINCQNRIEKKLKNLEGVTDAAVNYNTGKASVTFNRLAVTLGDIKAAIESEGYKVVDGKGKNQLLQIAGVLVIILAVSALLQAFSISTLAVSFPLAEAGMGYGMLLIIGLLTSVHCIAMCGGINLSQTLQKGDAPFTTVAQTAATKIPFDFSLLLPGVLYNGGRLISYTAVGVVVGALGSVISVSDNFRTIVLLLAGAFMIIMGLNMIGLFPELRRFTPRLPQFFSKKINRGPLAIGILNGFMPCGPLQAMQLYALSTGNPVKGGISMFLFCIGTIPLMFALGAAGGILSGTKGRSFSKWAMRVGAVLVAAMGVVMFANGWSSVSFTNPFNRTQPSFAAASTQREGRVFESEIQDGVQIVRSTLLPNRYPAITVQQGIPVRWIFNAPPGSINGCNNRFSIGEYGIRHTFKPGENIIEFMPEKAGRFRYSCWMNMLHGTIAVLAPGETIADTVEPDTTPKLAGVTIPTDTIAIAQIAGNAQTAEIRLDGEGFKPAAVVVQQGVPLLLTININHVGSNRIIFPAYYARMETEQGGNQVQVVPIMDFDFSTADNMSYGYIKVVPDITRVNSEAIKAEVSKYETLVYPEAYFEGAYGDR